MRIAALVLALTSHAALGGEGPKIALHGTGACPGRAALGAALARFGDTQEGELRIELWRRGRQLTVVLRDGDPTHRRMLTIASDKCTDAAQAVAFLVHSWLTQLPAVAPVETPAVTEETREAPGALRVFPSDWVEQFVPAPARADSSPPVPVPSAAPPPSPSDHQATIPQEVPRFARLDDNKDKRPPSQRAQATRELSVAPSLSPPPPHRLSLLASGGLDWGSGSAPGGAGGEQLLGTVDWRFAARWHALVSAGAATTLSMALADHTPIAVKRVPLLAELGYELRPLRWLTLDALVGPRVEIWTGTASGPDLSGNTSQTVPVFGATLGGRARFDVDWPVFALLSLQANVLGAPNFAVPGDASSAVQPAFVWGEAAIGLGIWVW